MQEISLNPPALTSGIISAFGSATNSLCLNPPALTSGIDEPWAWQHWMTKLKSTRSYERDLNIIVSVTF